MRLRDLRIRAVRESVFYDRIDLHGGVVGEGRQIEIVQPVTLKQVPEGQIDPPFLSLNPEQAQGLIDSLWECGLRPTEGTGSAGALSATQRHLEDMRRLVFEARR